MGFKRDEVGIGLCSAAFQADGKGHSHGCKLRISGVYIPSCRTWRHALKTTINTTRPNAVALNNESRTTCIEYCHHTGCQKVNKKKGEASLHARLRYITFESAYSFVGFNYPEVFFFFVSVLFMMHCNVSSRARVTYASGVVWYSYLFLFYLPLTSCFSSKHLYVRFECKTFWMEGEPSIMKFSFLN